MRNLNAEQRAEAERRLPLWARGELEHLRMRIGELERQRDELLAPDPDTNTYIENYGRPNRPLPRDERITFDVGGRLGQRIRVWIESGGIYIQGDRAVDIKPSAANALRVKISKD